MPQKNYGPRCDKRCVRCWENKINHGNKRKLTDEQWENKYHREAEEKNNLFSRYLRDRTVANKDKDKESISFDFMLYGDFCAWYKNEHPDDGDAVPSATQFRNGLRVHVDEADRMDQDCYHIKLKELPCPPFHDVALDTC